MQQSHFDPNAPGLLNNTIFGLPYSTEQAKIVLIPVPLDITVSYNDGTSNAPEQIFNASMQVDLYDPFAGAIWKNGIAMSVVSNEIKKANAANRKKAKHIIEQLALGQSENSEEIKNQLAEINKACALIHDSIYKQSQEYLNQNKLVGIIGGDHSSPFGLIKALASKISFGILHIDAHADLRIAYEGFEYSHASIMNHAIKLKNVEKLVQIGIRDYCDDELTTITENNTKITTFFDRDIKAKQYQGESWKNSCSEIIQHLPQNVYISFDVDGLDPKLCPNTGTPVPGGFEFEQMVYLFEQICNEGKKVIGFDVCEVGYSDNEWDASVGARIIYKLCGFCAKSNKWNNE